MKFLLTSILALFCLQTSAQTPPHQGHAPQGQQGPQVQKRPQGMPAVTGTFYGKIIDGKTGKPVEFAPVQLFTTKFDTVKNESRQALAGGQLTLANGDFSIENIPAFGKYTIRVAAMGYKVKEMQVSFDLKQKPDQMGRQPVVKDLGNIKLLPDSHLIGEVVVDGSDPSFRLEMDKKVYNVDKNPANTGTTAQEVLKNVPSVNVDLDGNVTMRNASPQIFVDGRPTTLTLEQIPADAIENIELITNPSAKYDAASGMGGIINIVMKKNRKMGYHGNVRAGVDMRGRFNTGGDFNMHQGKFNFFINGNFNQRYSIGFSETYRTGLTFPLTNTTQLSESHSKNYFGFGKIGFDYFMDIRNTFTVSASLHKGDMNPVDLLNVTSETVLDSVTILNGYFREADINRQFYNINGAFQYKHLFPEAGKELTADVNVTTVEGVNNGFYSTRFIDGAGNSVGNPVLQKQLGSGGNIFTTSQVDYVDPLNDKFKLETGVRASIRNFESKNQSLYYNYGFQDYIETPALTSSYSYLDQIYAGYTTLSYGSGKVSAQAGLRAESSDYSGFLPDSGKSFRVAYPVALFPSGFFSYKLSESLDAQITYTRKINRPNFFQLMPFTDYSDSLNYKRGNAALTPEFINSLELSLQKNISRGNSIVVSLYYKSVSNIITGYQIREYQPLFDTDVIINTFANADYGRTYGGELTTKNNIFKFIDLTLNLNVYNSEINASNVQQDLKNERLSYFGKANLNFRLPKNISFQLTGDYQSKTAIPVSRGDGMRGGGWMSGPMPVVQGYNWRGYEIGAALRYDFLKNRAASVTLAVSDILKSEIHRSHVETAFFVQDSERRRDQRFFRLNFSYRFGKMDVNLFRRKNTRQSGDGMDMGI